MRRFIFITILACMAITTLVAQRRITPVDGKAQSAKVAAKNAEFNDSLKRDSIAAKKDTSRNLHPRWTALTIGVNLWDPVMRLFGQSYGGFDASAEVSLYNRFFPTVEVGFGSANSTPDNGNFTYKSDFALYGKIGATYNFLFKKTSDYQFRLGFLIGYSSFKYDVTNISINSGYWGEHSTFELLNQKSDAFWGELVAGIRVKAYKNLSFGWSFRYRIMFKYAKNIDSDPWYIPGFGSRSNPIGASFSIYYTLPLSKMLEDKPNSKVKEVIDGIKNGAEQLPAKNDSIPRVVPSIFGPPTIPKPTVNAEPAVVTDTTKVEPAKGKSTRAKLAKKEQPMVEPTVAPAPAPAPAPTVVPAVAPAPAPAPTVVPVPAVAQPKVEPTNVNVKSTRVKPSKWEATTPK